MAGLVYCGKHPGRFAEPVCLPEFARHHAWEGACHGADATFDLDLWNDSLIRRCIALFAVLWTTANLVAAPPLVVGFDRFADKDSNSAGQVLLSELSCTACHATDQVALKPKLGPELEGAARRLRQEWIVRFLTSPQQTKPGTTMPDMFAAWEPEQRQSAVIALTAFLMTQRTPLPELKSTASNPIASRFWAKGDAGRGKSLYHRVGCVACHQPDVDHQGSGQPPVQLDEETMEELGITPERPIRSVPHANLSDKYSAQSLTHFLIHPLATRSSGRMPDLKLNPQEAADLVAHLLPPEAVDVIPELAPQDSELVSQGRRLFEAVGCVNCHRAGGVGANRVAPPLEALKSAKSSGCLQPNQRGMPQYDLDDVQRRAIEQAIADPIVRSDVDHRLRQLNCYACHVRQERGGVGPERRQFFETVGHVDLGDEGRIPPPLDGVGRKLTRPWIKHVLSGKGDVRPHLHARMPAFGTATGPLVDAFVAADLTEPTPDPFAGVASSAEAGRMLLDAGCVQCHPLRGEHLPGVLGTDLAEIDKRVRPQWFKEFILDPAGVKNRTRMPTFFRGGTSPNPEILDGDVDRQVASLWKYLSEIGRHALPDKIQQGREHNYELVPTDKPIVLRTFMDWAGPHAIAVGFPGQLNLAFDAESVRIAQLWKGRFLDAHGTWFDRFTPPAKPLGSEVINLAESKVRVDRQFKGYRLDADGIPTFLYRLGPVDVADRWVPSDDRGFVRTLMLSRPLTGPDQMRVWVPAISGATLHQREERVVENELGLTVSVVSGETADAQIKSVAGVSSWLIPATVGDDTRMEWEYRW